MKSHKCDIALRPTLHGREQIINSDRNRYKRYFRRHKPSPTADAFGVTMREAFALAEKQVPSIIVRRGLLGGNPCIKGTRIPVYMVLDGVEYHGTIKGVLKSYPQLTLNEVKDAVRFSKIVMEAYVEP